MSNINVQDVLQMLGSLSSARGEGDERRAHYSQKKTSNSESDAAFADTIQIRQTASEQCGSEELHAASLQLPSSAQNDEAALPSSRASADILMRWRAQTHGTGGPKDARPTASQSEPPAQMESGGPTTAPTSNRTSDLFRSGFRAATLDHAHTLTRLSGKSSETPHVSAPSESSKKNVFDAAEALFPDAAEVTEVFKGHKLPVLASSTMVQRVVRKLSGTQLRALHPGAVEPFAATVAVSDDGQEVLWQGAGVGGVWCSFFVRDVTDVDVGGAFGSDRGFTAALANDRAFCVGLPGRSFAFETETPQLVQLWLVGMLVLLHSTDAAWSAARICRYLAPWLLPGAPHQGFPPSVEKFMLGLQQAQESSAASAPFVKHDGPLMMGTFLRRVACAHLAIFMQTTVALGEFGLSLMDPNTGAEFARCDFRVEGITKNSVQFVEKSGLECGGESGGGSDAEQMTRCMLLKDSHAACHLILMPHEDIARDWEGSVKNVKAMLHSSFGRKSVDSVEGAVGIKTLLESLDHISPEIISQSVRAASAHTRAPRQSAFFLQNTEIEGLDVSIQSASSLQSRAQGQDRNRAEHVNAAQVARAPAPHVNPRVEAASRQQVLDPKPLAVRSRPHVHGDILHDSPQIRDKTQIVKHLQSLADNDFKMPMPSALPPAEIQKRIPAVRGPTPLQRFPAAPAPAALLPHETRHYDTKTVGLPAHVSASPALPRVLFSPSGSSHADSIEEVASSRNEPSAGEATAEVAARINSALAAFAKFGK